jgi:hypothetical protein
MTVDLGEGISGVRGSGFRKIGIGLCSNFVKREVPTSSENKPQVMATGRMGGRLREELMEIDFGEQRVRVGSRSLSRYMKS